jgi:hypothetical protein
MPAGSVILHNFGNRKTLAFRLKTPFLIPLRREDNLASRLSGTGKGTFSFFFIVFQYIEKQ